MVGTVNSRNEAIVPLRLKGPGGVVADVEVIVDTGFTGSLTLPAATVATLGLTLRSVRQEVSPPRGTSALGSQWQSILVSGLGHEVLLGMRLLAGHELRIKVVAEGSVDISKISAPAP
jgi:predicted aspartyl protease